MKQVSEPGATGVAFILEALLGDVATSREVSKGKTKTLSMKDYSSKISGVLVMQNR